MTAIGVVGVGTMGAKHARVLSEMRGAELIGVADHDDLRASRVADSYGTQARPAVELIEAADAIVIAVPTTDHYDIALECIAADTHILIEKPFVADPAEGRELIRLANETGLVLQVGHIERYNPAVDALFEFVDPTEIVALSANRLGPPVDRGIGDDVVTDLMIHDIDIILALLGDRPTTVSGLSGYDGKYASVLLEFPDDVMATLTASRVTQRKIRSLEVTTPDRLFSVDYLDQSVQIHRRSRPSYAEADSDLRYRHESVIERPLIQSAEPLKLELESFLTAITTDGSPRVTGIDGLKALSVVWSLTRQSENKAMEVSHS